MKYAKIIGTGRYLPSHVVTNADLEKSVETNNEWIIERTGIERRHVVSPGETCSMLAEKAARAAIENAQINPSDLDLIIVATTTPDKVLPCTACILQARLEIPGIPAFDIAAACAGYIYALSIADQFIKTGQIKTALVIGAEVMSSVIDWDDRSTCILFGDGAGATILQASSTPGILSTHIHANGNYKDMLYIPTSLPGQAKENEPSYVNMAGKEVFKFAVNTLEEIVNETLDANNIDKSEIDWLIPHQANIRIIKATAKKLNLPMERVILTIAEQGNTSAASIPLALDEAIRDGRIKRGQKLLMEAIGAGFAWGSALIEY